MNSITLGQINDNTPEGKLLMQALAILTVVVYPASTPDDVLRLLTTHHNNMNNTKHKEYYAKFNEEGDEPFMPRTYKEEASGPVSKSKPSFIKE